MNNFKDTEIENLLATQAQQITVPDDLAVNIDQGYQSLVKKQMVTRVGFFGLVVFALLGAGLFISNRDNSTVTESNNYANEQEKYSEIEAIIWLTNISAQEPITEEEERIAAKDEIELELLSEGDLAWTKSQITESLTENEFVIDFILVSKEETYRNFTEYFAESPEIANLTNKDMMPESYTVHLKPEIDKEEFRKQFKNYPGVREISFDEDDVPEILNQESMKFNDEEFNDKDLDCDEASNDQVCDLLAVAIWIENDKSLVNLGVSRQKVHKQIQTELDRISNVDSYSIFGQEYLYNYLNDQYIDSPSILDKLNNAHLLESFEVVIKPGTDPIKLTKIFEEIDGVKAVTYDQESTKSFLENL